MHMHQKAYTRRKQSGFKTRVPTFKTPTNKAKAANKNTNKNETETNPSSYENETELRTDGLIIGAVPQPCIHPPFTPPPCHLQFTIHIAIVT